MLKQTPNVPGYREDRRFNKKLCSERRLKIRKNRGNVGRRTICCLTERAAKRVESQMFQGAICSNARTRKAYDALCTFGSRLPSFDIVSCKERQRWELLYSKDEIVVTSGRASSYVSIVCAVESA